MRSVLGRPEAWLATNDRISPAAVVASRLCLALIFLMNGLGIVDQTRAASELVAHGMPQAFAPLFMLGGRVLQVLAGTALVLGVKERTAALALAAFLVPATVVAHGFWTAGAGDFQPQLVNFLKNVAIIGGLLFVAFRSDAAGD
jgi:putative oxidoreductase